MDQPGKVANPARGQLNREKLIFPCLRTRLRIWSRETGSAVPSRVSLLILHTQAEYGAYSRDSSQFPRRRPFIYLNRHTPLGQCRLYRVTQLLTDDVHCLYFQHAHYIPIVDVERERRTLISPWPPAKWHHPLLELP